MCGRQNASYRRYDIGHTHPAFMCLQFVRIEKKTLQQAIHFTGVYCIIVVRSTRHLC